MKIIVSIDDLKDVIINKMKAENVNSFDAKKEEIIRSDSWEDLWEFSRHEFEEDPRITIFDNFIQC